MVRRAKNVLFSSRSSLTRDDGSTSPKDVYNRSQLFVCQVKKKFHFEGQFHVEEEGNVPRSGISQNMAGWRLAIECTMRNTVRPLANSPHN